MNQENKQEQEYNPLGDLRELLDDWSNEIPNEILHGDSEADAPKFKVRKNWWGAVIGKLDYLVDMKIVSEELANEIEQFSEKFGGKSSDFNKRLTTIEDITEANALIDKVLESQK